MKQDWHPDELAHHWTLSDGERELLANKAGATRLGFTVLLKQFEGRFPDRRKDVIGKVVAGRRYREETGFSMRTTG